MRPEDPSDHWGLCVKEGVAAAPARGGHVGRHGAPMPEAASGRGLRARVSSPCYQRGGPRGFGRRLAQQCKGPVLRVDFAGCRLDGRARPDPVKSAQEPLTRDGGAWIGAALARQGKQAVLSAGRVEAGKINTMATALLA